MSEGGSVRNLAYLALSENRQNFHTEAGYVGCVTWLFHVACLLFVFLYRRLAVPQIRHGFKACHVSFLRRAGCCKGKGAETKKDVRFAGLAASNGRRREK